MLAFQPDIVQQQLLVRLTELQLLLARNQLLPQLNLNALYQFNGLGPPARPGRGGHAAGGASTRSTRSPASKNRTAGVNTAAPATTRTSTSGRSA